MQKIPYLYSMRYLNSQIIYYNIYYKYIFNLFLNALDIMFVWYYNYIKAVKNQ